MDYTVFEENSEFSVAENNYLESLFETCRLKGLSDKTFKAYYFIIIRYFRFINKSSLKMNYESVRYYLLSLNLSTNSSRLHYAALSFFYREILKMPYDVDEVPIKKKEKNLPRVLSKDQVKMLIAQSSNIKHKVITMLLYSSGLRLQEVVDLKRKDIDFDRNIIHVQNGKGKKDRITILGESLKKHILKYYTLTNFRTEHFIEGRNGKYSKKSVQQILKIAGKKADIQFNIHPHMLRHSFATHLVESGVDISYIQRLLGHSDVKTTNIYLHISNKDLEKIRNPLDGLYD